MGGRIAPNVSRGLGMPTFYKGNWGDYTVQIRNSSFFRELMRFYSFGANTEILPYFYSTYIKYNLLIKCNKKRAEDKINYEWVLSQSLNDIPVRKDEGSIGIRKWTVNNKKNDAIDIRRISKIGQYKLKIKLYTGHSTSSYMDIAEFTIKDKDEYGFYLLLALISAGIGAAIGAIVVNFS